ncbi:MAG: hypothetical protein MUP49_05635 [Dehalococcoidia bacterium]|nr:hypothetical protein [Dehalococcoidia bacterium]
MAIIVPKLPEPMKGIKVETTPVITKWMAGTGFPKAPLLYKPPTVKEPVLKRLYPALFRIDETNLFQQDEETIIAKLKAQAEKDNMNFLVDLYQRKTSDEDVRELFELMGIQPEVSDKVLSVYHEADIDEETVNESFKRLFPKYKPDEIVQTAEEDYDTFLQLVKSKGQNEDTTTVLRSLGYADTEINQMFAGEPTTIAEEQLSSEVFAKTPEGYDFVVTVGGQDTTLTLKSDMSVWQGNKKIATIDPKTGEFIPIDPALWQKMLSGGLKILEWINKPAELTGRGFVEMTDPLNQKWQKEVVEPLEKGLEELAKKYGYDPNKETPEQYKAEEKAISDRLSQAFYDKYNLGKEYWTEEEAKKRYNELPWWQQLILELPANIMLAVLANPAYSALANAAKSGQLGAKIAAKVGRIALAPYEFGSEIGAFSFNFTRETAEQVSKDITKVTSKTFDAITPEAEQILRTLGYTQKEILTMKVADAVKILKQADEAIKGGLKTGAETITGDLGKVTEAVETGVKGVEQIVPPEVPAKLPKPEVPTVKEGFIGNIKLDKFADDVIPDIKAFAESHPDIVQAVRRGIVSLEETEQAAEDLILKTGGDPKKLVKKVGQAYSDTEIRAIGGMLSDISNQMNDLRKVLATPKGNTVQNTLKLAELIDKHNYFQLAAHASRAEAGRALSSLRLIQSAINSNSNPIMEKVLKQIGKENYDEVLKAMQGLDWDNPVQVSNFIRQFKQPKLMDYINEIFINSILSGPKTHLVNGITNMVNTIMSPIERGVSAVVEKGLAKLQGREAVRFLDEVPADVWGMLDGIPEGIRGSLQTIKTGVSPTAATKYEFRVTAFKGKLGRVINFPTTALEAADNLHYNINFRQAFNAEAMRAGRELKLTGEELVDFLAETKVNPPADMVIEASKTANYRLFRAEGNGIADVLYKFRDWGFEVPKAGKITPLKFIIPFVRTPVNIVKYGLERSPLGFFNPELIRNLAKKSPEAADQIARAFIGTTLSATIALLFAQDKITGAAPPSEGERDRFYREGKQPYSVKIGDTWVSYQRLEPFNTSFTLVAIAVDAIKNDDAAADEKVMQAVTSFTKNFVSQTYMSGLADIVDVMQYPERAGGNILQSTGQALLVPNSSLMRTITQAVDPTIRQPKGFVEKLESGIPGLSWRVPPKLNVFGETTERQTPWYSPINITTEDNSRLNIELNKHDINIGFVGDSINNVKLTDDQQRKYQELAGTMSKVSILSLINSPEYKEMTDVEQKSAIQSASNAAREDARTELIQQGIVPSNKDDLKELLELHNKLGTQITPLPFLKGEKPEIYDIKRYFSEARQLIKTVKTSDIKDPLIQAVVEADGYFTEFKKFPNEHLYHLTSTEITTYLKKGGITKRDAELLGQYHSATDKNAFLAKYPQLRLNPQDAWLKANTQGNAMLAVFEQHDAITSEAKRIMQELIETLDIPDIALPEGTTGVEVPQGPNLFFP